MARSVTKIIVCDFIRILPDFILHRLAIVDVIGGSVKVIAAFDWPISRCTASLSVESLQVTRDLPAARYRRFGNRGVLGSLEGSVQIKVFETIFPFSGIEAFQQFLELIVLEAGKGQVDVRTSCNSLSSRASSSWSKEPISYSGRCLTSGPVPPINQSRPPVPSCNLIYELPVAFGVRR